MIANGSIRNCDGFPGKSRRRGNSQCGGGEEARRDTDQNVRAEAGRFVRSLALPADHGRQEGGDQKSEEQLTFELHLFSPAPHAVGVDCSLNTLDDVCDGDCRHAVPFRGAIRRIGRVARLGVLIDP